MKKNQYSGSCLCGQVQYSCVEAPLISFICHCRQCQKAHAAPFCAEAAMPVDSIKIQGELKEIAMDIDDGAKYRRYFCPECGSHITGQSENFPGITMLKVATLDDPERFEPDAHLFTVSQLSWCAFDENTPRYEGIGPKSEQAKT